MRKNGLIPFSIYITRELRHKIRECAAKHDQEMSPWIVNAIESYLKFVEPSLPRPNARHGIKGSRRALKQEIEPKKENINESN